MVPLQGGWPHFVLARRAPQRGRGATCQPLSLPGGWGASWGQHQPCWHIVISGSSRLHELKGADGLGKRSLRRAGQTDDVGVRHVSCKGSEEQLWGSCAYNASNLPARLAVPCCLPLPAGGQLRLLSSQQRLLSAGNPLAALECWAAGSTRLVSENGLVAHYRGGNCLPLPSAPRIVSPCWKGLASAIWRRVGAGWEGPPGQGAVHVIPRRGALAKVRRPGPCWLVRSFFCIVCDLSGVLDGGGGVMFRGAWGVRAVLSPAGGSLPGFG